MNLTGKRIQYSYFSCLFTWMAAGYGERAVEPRLRPSRGLSGVLREVCVARQYASRYSARCSHASSSWFSSRIISNISCSWIGGEENVQIFTTGGCYLCRFTRVFDIFTYRGTLRKFLSCNKLHVQVFALRLPSWFDQPLEDLWEGRTDEWTNGRSSSSKTQGNISNYGNEHQPHRPTVPLSKTSHTLTATQCTLSPSPLPLNYSCSPNITAALSMRVWKMRLSFQKIKPAQVITRLSLLL